MSSGLKIKNLYFKDALTDVNFELKPGTITALVGKSGSGKTLILKSVVSFINYSGIITLNETILNEKNIYEEIKNIGIYLNIKPLNNNNVVSNIMEPLLNLNYEEEVAKKTVYELSKKLGIDDLLNKEVNTLSYSQKKVVSFAQSIVHNPKLILIDNLFDSLDENYKYNIISYLKNLKKDKKTIILFTTNNAEDLLIADNLLIVKNGKIVEHGQLNQLFKKENLFSKNDIQLPFICDLSNKMISYELIDDLIYDMNEMVDRIWQ